MSAPGKLNTSSWEKKTEDPTKPTGLKGKASMFEQAAKDAAPKVAVQKKTWAVSGNSGGNSNQGKYKGKTQIGNGPPPAKSIHDLP